MNTTFFQKYINKYKGLPVQVKASFWFLVCSFLQRGVSFITTPIYSRLLSTAEYGQYSVFNSWLSIITLIVSLNLSWGVYTQGLVKFDEKKEIFSSSLQGLTLLLVSVWTCIYLVFRQKINSLLSLTTPQILFMFIIIWTGAVFEFWAAEQRVRYKYRMLVSITLAATVLGQFLGVFLVIHLDNKVNARILGIVLIQIIAYAWMFFYQVKKGKVFYCGQFWKYAISFNIPLIPHYLSLTILNSSDRIMIEKMVDDSSAGIYGLAYSIGVIVTVFANSLMSTLSPWIYQKIKLRREKDIAKVSYICILIVAFLNLILISFSPEAVKLFAPNAYYDAIWVIPPIAMSTYFVFLYNLFSAFEFYFEKTKYIMLASTLSAVLNIILNYIFIRIFGYYAAGYTTLICYMVYAMGHYLFMQKICDEKLNHEGVYSKKILCLLTVIFVSLGFLIMSTYNIPLIRYGIILLTLIIAVIKRTFVIDKLNAVYSIIKNEKQ